MNRKLLQFLFTTLFCASASLAPATINQAGAQESPLEESVSERLLWSSEPERPAWTFEEPEAVGDQLLFVGLSAPLAEEQAARHDALINGIEQIVHYAHFQLKQQLAESKQKKLQAVGADDYRLAREFDLRLAIDLVSRVKPQQWYQERWQTGTQTTEHLYVLVAVDKAVIEASLHQKLKQLYEEAAWQLEEQQQKAAEFWKQLQAESPREK